MGNHFTHPTSIIQAEDGGFVFVGTWNESGQATSDQRFWLVKIAAFNVIPSSVWLSIEIVTTVVVAAVEISLAFVIHRKRATQKTSAVV